MSDHVRELLDRLQLRGLKRLYDDDTSYLYYDRKIRRGYEASSVVETAIELIKRISIGMLLTIAVIALVAFLISLLKLILGIIWLSWVIHYVVYAIVIIFIIVIANIFYRRGRADLLLKQLKGLILRRRRGEDLQAGDFVRIAALRSMSEGRSSLNNILHIQALIVICLWLIVFKDVDFSSMFSLIFWGVVVVADALTLTLFDLTGRIGVTPNASVFVVYPLQAVLLVFSATNMFDVHMAGIRGYRFMGGNKFAARGDYAAMITQIGYFNDADEMAENARFVEVTTSEQFGAAPSTMTLAQLDETIIRHGQEILSDAERYFGQNGEFDATFAAAMEEIV